MLRLVERVHVTAQRHGDAALRSLHLLLLLLRNAVFGKRLERSLGSKLRVVVQGEDGGFGGLGRVGLILLLLLLLRRELLLLGLWLLLLLLVLGHAGLLRSHLLLLWLLRHLLLRVSEAALLLLLRHRLLRRHVLLRCLRLLL